METSESQAVPLSIESVSCRTVLRDKAGELVKESLYTCFKGWIATLLRYIGGEERVLVGNEIGGSYQ